MKVSLSNMPSQHRTQVVDFSRLDGGLNLWELDYRLDANQTASMKNLWWQDGVLQCRDGQTYVYCAPEWASPGRGYTCFQELFWDAMFMHIGDKIYYMYLDSATPTPVELVSGVPENRGTFFRYNDWLYYKNRGGFIRIKYTPDARAPFTASDIRENAYTPTIILNANPGTGSGDAYQPENRFSPKKTVCYNALAVTKALTLTGAGTNEVSLGVTASGGGPDDAQLIGVETVYKNGALVNPAAYSVDLATGRLLFSESIAQGVVLVVNVTMAPVRYQIPVSGIDEVSSVFVDGKAQVPGVDYTANLTAGYLVFVKAPTVYDPARNNTVEITFSKENPDAAKAIMDCPYAAVYGGDQNVCIVLGGCAAQPNAFFWNSNDSLGMNDTYWPMSYYQLAGDTEDGITGFGRQYGDLVVFKGRSIGKAAFDVVAVDERDSISLTYVNINSKIGCDLPWTIQLIENNLVFCNTRSGVHVIRDTSSANENNVEGISRNVNGTEQRLGLLHDLRQATADTVCSYDDDTRYWVCANGRAYVWDYQLSSYSDPSWFLFTGIGGVAYLRTVDKTYHMDVLSRVTLFERTFADYNQPIEKLYQFPPQAFGSYDRLKDVLYVILTIRSDTDSFVQIKYISDYEERYDATDLRMLKNWVLAPRDLSYRSLAVRKFAQVVKRKPGCRHIRHFSMLLSNAELGQDLAILSAQIYFRYLGRDR